MVELGIELDWNFEQGSFRQFDSFYDLECGRGLRAGVSLQDGVTAPARVRILKRLRKKTWLEMEIHEGRYREVRRIFEALGYSVEKLVRTRFGPIRLGSLPIGGLHPLRPEEIESLQRAVGLSTKHLPRSNR